MKILARLGFIACLFVTCYMVWYFADLLGKMYTWDCSLSTMLLYLLQWLPSLLNIAYTCWNSFIGHVESRDVDSQSDSSSLHYS